jgi:hypothetical protein
MMPLQNLWQLAWDDLPLDPTGTLGAAGIADFMDAQTSLLLEPKAPPFLLPGPGTAIFTFGKAACASAMVFVTGVTTAAVIADGWQAGVLASTLVIPPGSSTTTPPLPAGAGTFSVVASVTVNPASLAAAYATLSASLLAAPLANSKYADTLLPPLWVPPPVPASSQVPIYLRDAFLALKFDIIGTNSVAPTPAPLNFTTDVM